MHGAQYKVLYESDLPDAWKSVMPDDVRQTMATRLGISAADLCCRTAFSGPQCKQALACVDEVARVHEQNHCPGNNSLRSRSGDFSTPAVPITLCIENPASWVSSKKGNSINGWVRHLVAHGHPPLSSLARIMHKEDDKQPVQPSSHGAEAASHSNAARVDRPSELYEPAVAAATAQAEVELPFGFIPTEGWKGWPADDPSRRDEFIWCILHYEGATQSEYVGIINQASRGTHTWRIFVEQTFSQAGRALMHNTPGEIPRSEANKWPANLHENMGQWTRNAAAHLLRHIRKTSPDFIPCCLYCSRPTGNWCDECSSPVCNPCETARSETSGHGETECIWCNREH